MATRSGWSSTSGVLAVVKRVAPWAKRSNFVRYNWRGWEVDDKAESHLEMGDVYMQVTPGGNSLYICNPDALLEIFKRRGDFPRPLQLFGTLSEVSLLCSFDSSLTVVQRF